MKSVLIIYLLVLFTLCQCIEERRGHKKPKEKVKDEQKIDNSTNNSINEFVVGGGKIGGGNTLPLATSANFPWIVSVLDIDGATTSKKGPGVIVGTQYVLLHSTAASISLPTNSLLVSKSDTIGVYNNLDAMVRRGRLQTTASGTDVAGYLAIIKVCPAFPASFIAPMPVMTGTFTPYASGTTVRYYNFFNSDKLATVDKAITASTGCSNTNYMPVAHTFCVPGSGSNSLAGNDYTGTIATINGIFVGINLKPGGGGANNGELFADIRYYNSFITNPQF